jgi:hypothetical protein
VLTKRTLRQGPGWMNHNGKCQVALSDRWSRCAGSRATDLVRLFDVVAPTGRAQPIE